MTENIRILFVEDDKTLGRDVEELLKRNGYQVTWVESADRALAHVKEYPVDLFLLDINLPGLSGLKLLEIFRQIHTLEGVPAVFLTSEGGTKTKLSGFSAGADDYIVKPFAPEELLARLEAIIRRTRYGGKDRKVLEAGGLTYDLETQDVRNDAGNRYDLTYVEKRILEILMRRRGYVVSYQNLADSLSEKGKTVQADTLYAHLKNLRHKLGPKADLIETIKKIGYRFQK
jgi:DNA-binding response OmpR family regulator